MSSLPEKNLTLSWKVFHRDTKALARILASKDSWGTIVAITRGGLIPAAIIAQDLDIRIIDTVCVTSYNNKQHIPLTVLKNIEPRDEKLLFIDDLVDTGNTARTITRMFPHAHYAVVYAKPAGKPFIDSYVTEVSQDTWVVFPWNE